MNCNDYTIVPIISAVQNIINIIQIVVPILLIISIMIELYKLMSNPEDKKVIKRIKNKTIAAFTIFFIPMLVSIAISLTSSSISFSACIEASKTMKNNFSFNNIKYQDIDDNNKKTSLYNDPSKYENGEKKKTNSSKSKNNTSTNKTVDSYMEAVKNTVEEAKSKNYHYGDSHATPPTTDGLISCDRLEAKALWDIGYTDQRSGGEVVSTLDSYLTSHGWTKSTNINDCKYGSIVLVSHNGTSGPPYHAFTVLSYNPKTGAMQTYDEGAEWRIHSNQPFNSGWTQSSIYGVYNMN